MKRYLTYGIKNGVGCVLAQYDYSHPEDVIEDAPGMAEVSNMDHWCVVRIDWDNSQWIRTVIAKSDGCPAIYLDK